MNQLCRSYLAISEDPVVGNEQKGLVFWERILEHMKTHNVLVHSSRGPESLRSRFGDIQRDVQKFQGCIKKVEMGGTSGMSIEDRNNKAIKLFEEIVTVKTPSGIKSKKFLYFSCWCILKDSPKFRMENFQTTRKRSCEGDSEDNEETSSFSSGTEDSKERNRLARSRYNECN